MSKLWAMTVPYWRSADWKLAWLLSVIVIALNLALVGMNVLFNYWYNDFYNSLQNKDFAAFKYQLGKFAVLAFVYIVIAVYYLYLRQMLMIRWRRWLTENLLQRWLGNRVYYLLQLKDYGTDNPEQRIEQDINLYTQQTVAIAMGLLNSIVTLFSFMFILWTLSGPLSFVLGGMNITIPGYMLWVALIYALIGSVLTYWIGRPLVHTNFMQERFNANFRFGMSRLRENAESVAFYGGEADETRRLEGSFRDIWNNWYLYMRQTKRITWFTSFYGQAAVIFPFLVGAPRYFSGAIQLGGLMQINSAFSQVQGALSWFVDSFTTLADWKASVNRLVAFVDAIDYAQADAAQMARLSAHDRADNALVVDNLDVALPDGRLLLDDVDLTLLPEQRVMVSGPSGSGKTTLFRALAGLWPFGRGKVHLPKQANMLFLPQRPYLPIASLRDALTFPLGPGAFSREALIDALASVNLGHLVDRLDETDNWSMVLSGGEQQRLAIARAILVKPDWLFLDEGTSALDEANEEHIYRLLVERLPKASIISIAHRGGLARFHDRRLTLDPKSQRVSLSAIEAAA
ncbi:ABC transporter ATP-binding protein/permease [Dongia soli]|uniref:ABC transporter ATP-binding protein/permease n=1 Tax=Dongia soli TaxID=600628 RepID=A0ABU5E8N8_9PROT|nr:ABC transporter ATP-binding protein/permease [Dongia soli]MDY0882569.1 ABC transporter ATP-binding protein/permease [Dongia soli]